MSFWSERPAFYAVMLDLCSFQIEVCKDFHLPTTNENLKPAANSQPERM